MVEIIHIHGTFSSSIRAYRTDFPCFKMVRARIQTAWLSGVGQVFQIIILHLNWNEKNENENVWMVSLWR